MDNRNFTSSAYRYGFNGMEKDSEIKGEGNSYDFGARLLDPRLGRWLSIDPLSSKYPGHSPYHFAANSPIFFLDSDGKANTIYLYTLNDSEGKPAISKREARKIVKETKARFKEMGLTIDVKTTTEFRPDLIDPSDSYAIIAKSPADAGAFIKSKIEDEKVSKNLTFDPAFFEETDSWDKSYNPGESSKKGNAIFIYTDNIKSSIDLANDKEVNTGGRILITEDGTRVNVPLNPIQLNEGSQDFDLISGVAYMVTHGAGHNSGLGHTNENAYSRFKKEGYDPNETGTFMSEGDWIYTWSKDAWKDSKTITEDQTSKMKTKFSATEAKDNLTEKIRQESNGNR